jgi:hypothetical protein
MTRIFSNIDLQIFPSEFVALTSIFRAAGSVRTGPVLVGLWG